MINAVWLHLYVESKKTKWREYSLLPSSLDFLLFLCACSPEGKLLLLAHTIFVLGRYAREAKFLYQNVGSHFLLTYLFEGHFIYRQVIGKMLSAKSLLLGTSFLLCFGDFCCLSEDCSHVLQRCRFVLHYACLLFWNDPGESLSCKASLLGLNEGTMTVPVMTSLNIILVAH